MKNIDYINSIVSSKLGVDKDFVKVANKVYWKTIKHKMQNLEDTTIFVKGFVSFTASRYLINERIKYAISYIKNIDKSKKFTDNMKAIIKEKNYNYLRKLLKQRNEVAKIYYERTDRILETDTESD